MKKALFFFTAILFIACNGQNIEYKDSKKDWEKENLKGKVSSLYINDFINKRQYIYNSEGYLTEEKVFLENNNFLKKEVLYTEKGNKIKEIGYNRKGEKEYYSDYKYDQYEYLKEWVTYTKGNFYKKLLYNYDEKGNESEVYIYFNENTFEEKWINKYDNINRLIEKEKYTSNNILLEKYIYKYNEKENIKCEILEKEGVIINKTFYKYDKNNNIIEEQTYRNNILIDMRAYTYIYDTHKNWTKKFLLQDLNEVLFEERKITYYQ